VHNPGYFHGTSLYTLFKDGPILKKSSVYKSVDMCIKDIYKRHGILKYGLKYMFLKIKMFHMKQVPCETSRPGNCG